MVTIPKGSFDIGRAPGGEVREGVPEANRHGGERRITIDSFALG
jgi:hypothetical protein